MKTKCANMDCDLTDGVYAKCGDPITCSQRKIVDAEIGWSCVWCGKPVDTKDPCNAPDGDGHLFRQNPTGHAPARSAAEGR